MEQKRVMRSRKERMIAGVCGGIAEHFNADPTLVRLLFVLATLVQGVGLIVYLALWVIVPEAPLAEVKPPAPDDAAAESPVQGSEASRDEEA